jgi:hypothetical protein
MKRFFIVLAVILMTISMIACSSTNNNPSSSDTPKVADSTATSPKTSETSTPAQQVEKKPETATQTENKPVSAPEPEKKPEPTPQPEKKPEPAPQPEKKPEPAPQPEKKSEPAPQPEKKPVPVPVPAPQAEEISPKGKKLLLVGRENAPDDVVVAGRLKALGFTVTTMIDREFTVDETKGYDLIYISQTLNSKIIKGGVMKDVAIPTVYVKNHGMFYLGLSSIEENANVLNVKSIDIADSNHKVAGGLSGTVDIYKETNAKIGISYGLPGKEAKVIATAPGDKEKAAIYYYDKGKKADNGYELKARVSFFYMNNGMQENTTDTGWKLLENLVVWTLQNG